MKNVSTKKFYENRCRKFLVKRDKHLDFILEFKTMKECYDSLLAGHPFEELARERMASLISYPGFIPAQDLMKYRVECVRRIERFIKNEKSLECFRVCCNYAQGLVTDAQLSRSREGAFGVWKNNHSSIDAAHAAAQCAFGCFDFVVECASYQGEEEKEVQFQLELFRRIGNPFVD